MREFGWSWETLQSTPAFIVERAFALLSAEAAQRERENSK